MMSCALAQSAFVGKAVRVTALRSRALSNTKVSAASRPIWYPGNDEAVPSYLDGSLAGDYGFDPLGLGSDPDQLKWNVQAELIHCRLAMMGVAGCLERSLAKNFGAPAAEWFEGGKAYMDAHPEVSLGALIWTTFALCGFVELKRLQDIRNPGSQGDGSFLGVTDGFKGTANGYPGGVFDFMGMAKGDGAAVQTLKQKEVKNGRLAMIAFLGFAAQYAATGKGPVDNLIAHLADPGHVNCVSNGVSVPFISN